MPAAASLGRRSSWRQAVCSASIARTPFRTSVELLARRQSPSSDFSVRSAESWSRRPETRIMKNSSRLLSEMQRNFSRSRSGQCSSRASSRTRWLKSSQESSRFRSGVRGAAEERPPPPRRVSDRPRTVRRRVVRRGGRVEEGRTRARRGRRGSACGAGAARDGSRAALLRRRGRRADRVAQGARELVGDRLDRSPFSSPRP